ncbi:MAG TPA: response regulator [Planctomycetota bacterium]|nr:response regulator [Planctomycetota bacterium]
MLELKNWYRERLGARIAALEECLEGLRQGKPESVESVRRLAHSLRGSGATYGFPEITEAARVLEEAPEADLPARTQELVRTLLAVREGARTTRHAILVVEDDEDQARFIVETLSAPERDVYEARTAAQALEILEEREISLIVLDLILPDTDGRNFLVRLRERLATAALPVIVLTVKRASQAKAECLALGADDFIEKPAGKEALRAAVEARLRAGGEGARELRRDPVTSLPNRAAFTETFQRSRPGIAPGREPVTVALLEIDGFAQAVERGEGGPADPLLKKAGELLSRALRPSEFLARWGGGEFAVLFTRTDLTGAVFVLRKALRSLEQQGVVLSAGVVPVLEGLSLDDVLSDADRFLHAARDAGGDRVVSSADGVTSRRRRVLIAEDDELIRLVVKRLLEREGFEVLPHAEGGAALQGAIENPCDLVLTDIRMPGMDGFELVRRLRALPEYSAVPVVILTSLGSEEDVVRGFQLGADDYVVKPFSSGELIARVRRLLRGSRVGA